MIVVVGGAINNLILFVGDVQIPAEAVQLMFTSNGIEPAEGPAGGNPEDGSPGFVDPSTVTVGDEGEQNDLLGDSDGPAGAFGALDELSNNLPPTILSITGDFILADDGLPDGNRPDGESDTATVSGQINAADPDGLFFSIGAPTGTFTSGGYEIVWDTTDPQHVIGNITIPPANEGGDPEIRMVADGTVSGTGAWTITLYGPIDHVGGANDDALSMPFNFVVSDGFGATTPVTITFTVEDDEPVLEKPELGNASDAEAGAGAPFATGSLGISWGADRGDEESFMTGRGNRSVAFTNAEVAVANSYLPTLTSLGVAVHYTLIDGVLVGYASASEAPLPPKSNDDPSIVFTVTLSDDLDSGSYAFDLRQPLDQGDSDAFEDGSLDLTFNFTATDADGDPIDGTFTVNVADTLSTINAEAIENGIVEEEQGDVRGAGIDFGDILLGTGPAEDQDTLFNQNNTTRTASGDLGVVWGADNADDEGGQPGDRSVAFADGLIATLEAKGIESRGSEVHYVIKTIGGQPVLFAYTGETEPSALPDGNAAAISAGIVFTVALSDGAALADTGSWEFKLYDTIEAYDAQGGNIAGENLVGFDFALTATDSDGDTSAPASFHVDVIDDELVVGTSFIPSGNSVEEEHRATGNEDLVANPDFDADRSGNLNRTNGSASGTLGIFWGGDDADGADATVDGLKVQDALGAGRRHVEFATADGPVSAADAAAFLTVVGNSGPVALGQLTSGGVPLTFALSNHGSILTAYAGVNVVFTVNLSDDADGASWDGDGTFQFRLVGVLDHPVKTGGASNEDQLAFAFKFTASDGDNDKGTGTFIVSVIDDVPVIKAGNDGKFTATVSESALEDGNGAAIDPSLPTGVSTSATGDFSSEVSFGADGKPAHALQSVTINNITLDVDIGGNTFDSSDFGVLGDVWSLTVSANGVWTFQLNDNTLDHENEGLVGGADQVEVPTITATLVDGDGDPINVTLDIDINDDGPIANDDPGELGDYTATEGLPAAHNLILAFDTSGSMAENDDGSLTYDSRLEFARAAAVDLIQASGAASVLIVTFAGTAASHGWMPRQDAIDYLENDANFPNPTGGTDYGNALAAIQAGYAGHPEGDASVYFFSDGEAEGSGNVSGAELTAWNNFLNSNGIESYAVGLGNDVDEDDNDLEDVANPNADHVIILDSGDLDTLDELLDTAQPVDGASGNVLVNDDFGADGGHILSITVDGVTYTWDGLTTITKSGGDTGTQTGSSISVDTPLDGHLTFNFANGAWTYQAPEELVHNATEVFNYSLIDGDGDTDDANLTVNVVAVNDAPVNSVPNELEVDEDITTRLSGIQIADVDADGEDVTVTLSIPNGYGTLSAVSDGLVGVSGSPTSLVLTGTVAEINAFLSLSGNGAFYTSARNANSDVTLTVTTNDQGNNGTGPVGIDIDTIRLDLHAVNDAPVLAPDTNTIGFTENASAVRLMPTATVTDPDNPSDYEDGFVEVSLAGTVAGDRLVLANSGVRVINGDDVQVNLGSGWVTIGEITGGGFGGTNTTVHIDLDDDATDARVERLLRAIAYESTSENPTNATRTATVTFNDGSNDGSGPAISDTSTITINVTPINDAPTLDLNAGGSGSGGTGDSQTFTEGGVSVRIADTDSDISDADGTMISKMEITLTNMKPGDQLTYGTAPNGVTVDLSIDGDDYKLTIITNATHAAFETFLESVRFSNTSQAPETQDRVIQVVVYDDAGLVSNTATSTIDVNAVNDAPVNSVPGAQGVNEDTNTVFNVANGNPIAISDVDAGNDDVRVTISVQHGTLTLSTISGLAFIGGTSNGTGSMTIEGSIAQINAALDGLIYKGAANYFGPDSLSIVTNDLGNNGQDPNQTGTGSSEQDSDSVAITVAPVNDAPTLSLGTTLSAENYRDEFGSISYSNSNGTTNWSSTPWTESSGSGASNGEFQVTSGQVLRLTDDDTTSNDDYIERTVNLDGAVTATFDFTYRRSGLDSGSDEVRVYVSKDGTTNFVLLATLEGPGTDGTYQDSLSYDISAYISATTKIRFVADNDLHDDDYIFIDNVQVSYTKATPVLDHTTSYTENGTGVAIAASAASVVADVDNTNMESATITLVNGKPGDVLSIAGSLPSGILLLSITGTLPGPLTMTLTGTASKSAYETAIEAVRFSSTSESPSTEQRDIQVTVYDGAANSNIAHTYINVTAVNDNPVITSDGGLAAAAINVAENTAAVTTVTSTDVDGPPRTYSIVGGADQLKFDINANTGALAFKVAPDFETPSDVGADNVYDVIVQASDGSAVDQQAIAVTVTDVQELVAPTVNDVTGTATYAFAKNGLNPDQIQFDAASLFTGTGLTFTVEETFTTAGGGNPWNWLHHSVNSTEFGNGSGGAANPSGAHRGIYIAKVTATNALGSAYTYVAFSVLGDNSNDGSRVDIVTAASMPSFDNWRDNLIVYQAGVNYVPQVNSASANDVIIGNEQNNRATGDSADDLLYGGAGNDSLDGGSGRDYLNGGAGNDTLNAGTDGDWLDGGSGNDVLTGSSVSDVLIGGSDNDTISGGGGNDWIDGGAGNDSLTGGSVNDTIYGGSGDDTINGNNGADLLLGGPGNSTSTLNGGAGIDTLTGGAGVDRFVFKNVDAMDFVTDLTTGSSNRDILDLSDLLSNWAASGREAHVRIEYAGGAHHTLSDLTDGPAIDGDVKVQVEVTAGNWTNVVQLTDNGNLSIGNNTVSFILTGNTVITDDI